VSFKFGDIRGSATLAVESLEIEIDDTNQGITGIILNEDIRNKWAILYFGVVARTFYEREVIILEAGETLVTEGGDTMVTEGSTTQGADYYKTEIVIQEFTRGIIGGWEMYDDNLIKMTITNELVLWNKRPLRIQMSSCPWTFNKSPYTNVITNGSFDTDTDGWNAVDCTPLSVAGGEFGNCLQITRDGGTSQYVGRSIPQLTASRLYRLSFYVKSGTSGNEQCSILINEAGVLLRQSMVAVSSNSWVQHVLIFTAGGTEDEIIIAKNSATAGTMLFDEVCLYEITECGYIGAETWCDQSYERCATLMNTANFGGERFLPALMEKEIWWGRSRSI
jgi:hypothetical protein